MKIRKLATKSVRGIADRTFSFQSPRDGRAMDVVLVTGGPASGKTSLLGMIAAAWDGLGGSGAPPAASSLLAAGALQGELRAEWELSEEEQRDSGANVPVVEATWNIGRDVAADAPAALRLLSLQHRGGTPGAKLEWIPAHRRLPTDRAWPLPPPLSATVEASKRGKDAREKYDSLLRGLHDGAVAQAAATATLLDDRGIVFRAQVPDGAAAVKENVARMCPELRLIAVAPRPDRRPLVVLQRRDGRRIELEGLSAGEHQGFLFALVFASLGLERAVVLIDTPEAFIHPDEQARFFQALCQLGSGNQIIAATTSAPVLASVAPERVIDLSKLGGS
jgi:energy-coupling factor transporter ATP-binding protein EcfA2